MTTFGDQAKRRYPVLDTVFTSFFQCRNDDLLDPVAALDEGVREARGRGREAARELRQLLADEPDAKSVSRTLSALGLDEAWYLPGDPHSQYLLAARRMEAYPANGSEYVDAPAVPLERSSRWLTEQTAEATVRRTLEHFRGELELWMRDRGGLPRVCLSLEFEEQLGWVSSRGDDTVASSCAVVVAWDPVQPIVKASYPDLTQEPRWREGLPDLAHVFGGYFGQHTLSEFGNEWNAFGAVLNWFDPPARGRVVDELAQLLTLPEPEAQIAVRNLGSYVVPPDTLGWLERLHWVLAETRERPWVSGEN